MFSFFLKKKKEEKKSLTVDQIPPNQIKTRLWKVSTKIHQSSPDGQFSSSSVFSFLPSQSRYLHYFDLKSLISAPLRCAYGPVPGWGVLSSPSIPVWYSFHISGGAVLQNSLLSHLFSRSCNPGLVRASFTAVSETRVDPTLKEAQHPTMLLLGNGVFQLSEVLAIFIRFILWGSL